MMYVHPRSVCGQLSSTQTKEAINLASSLHPVTLHDHTSTASTKVTISQPMESSLLAFTPRSISIIRTLMPFLSTMSPICLQCEARRASVSVSNSARILPDFARGARRGSKTLVELGGTGAVKQTQQYSLNRSSNILYWWYPGGAVPTLEPAAAARWETCLII